MKKLLLTIGILLTIFALLFVLGQVLGGGQYVNIYLDGELYASVPLWEDRTVRLEQDGEFLNEIVIRDGKAYVSSASCPDQICVHTPAVTEEGGTVVCLPHRLVIKTGGKP